MATKEPKNQHDHINQELEPASKREISPANIIISESENSDIDIPAFLKEKDAIQRAAPEGFAPLIDFADEPGKWIMAQYIGERHGVGPNESAMYEFRVPQKDGTMLPASLWGSTILDTKIAQVKPMALDWLFIQYIRAVQTKRAKNPAKDFRVMIVTPTIVDKELDRMGFKKST